MYTLFHLNLGQCFVKCFSIFIIIGTLPNTTSYTLLINDIVLQPGGTSYYYSNQPGDNTLYDAFAATMERGEVDDNDRRIQV